MKPFASSVVAAFALLASAAPASAADVVAGELIVAFERGTSALARARVLDAHGVRASERLPVPGLELARVGRGASATLVAQALARAPAVRYAEPNYVYRFDAVPSDPRFVEQWALDRIEAPEAWDRSVGSASAVVAVVDSGADLTHPDLRANLVAGWDFAGRDDDPSDRNGHGTHVAGTVGAVGDNFRGIAGVNWDVSLLPLRAGSDRLSTAAVVAAFQFACGNGVRIVNASFGRVGPLPLAIRDAVEACDGTLFVFAAGNGGANNDEPGVATYPCALSSPNVVCVAASDENDSLAEFSNYGATSVDLAAPGTSILSTVPGGRYESWDGTSMAAPHVSGVAALLLALVPDLTVAEVRASLLSGVDRLPALRGKVATGGRLNAFRAVSIASRPFVSISNARVRERDRRSRPGVFVVRLSAASAESVTVSLRTRDGTARAPSDYRAKSRTITFLPGETVKSVHVRVRGDRRDERSERFFVKLSRPTGATLLDRKGIGKIIDDD